MYVDLGDKNMRVWLACFLVLFALAEFFDWLKAFSLPLPIYILGGAFLAVASNYDKIVGSYASGVTSAKFPVIPKINSLDASEPVALNLVDSVEKHQQSTHE
jgi:hypothetical protein